MATSAGDAGEMTVASLVGAAASLAFLYSVIETQSLSTIHICVLLGTIIGNTVIFANGFAECGFVMKLTAHFA